MQPEHMLPLPASPLHPNSGRHDSHQLQQQALLHRHRLTNRLSLFPPRAVGDTIPINYNNKRYFIDIVEAKPGAAISVIETDCNVSRHGAGRQ